MAINLYTVVNDLNEKKWTLLTTEYKNLQTPMSMKCPQGHLVTLSYGDWRKAPICRECEKGDTTIIDKNNVPNKEPNIIRYLALDAASHVTGYSIYDNGQLVSYGLFNAKGMDATERIASVEQWLDRRIEQWKPDLIGIEHIQLQTFGGKPQVELYRVLANLQGVLMNLCYKKNIEAELIRPSEWRESCNFPMAQRDSAKKCAQRLVRTWFDIEASEDEADAICIGKHLVKRHYEKTKPVWGEEI